MAHRAEAAGGDGGHLAVVEDGHGGRVAHDRGEVGGDEHLLVTDARRPAGCRCAPRRCGRGSRRAARRGRTSRPPRASASRTLPSSVSASLRATRWASTSVSVSLASVTPASVSCGAQGGGVVDDAVVHDRDPAGLVGVRVGVGVGGRAVRRPAGVADPGRAGEALGQRVGQVAHPAGLLGHPEPASGRGPRRPPSRSRGAPAGSGPRGRRGPRPGGRCSRRFRTCRVRPQP